MCYSAMCNFQDHMGECRIRDYNKFKERFGESACVVGGAKIYCREDEEYFEENSERFQEYQKQAWDEKFVW